jgi:hypothetical protein
MRYCYACLAALLFPFLRLARGDVTVPTDAASGEDLVLMQSTADEDAGGECTQEHFDLARAYLKALNDRDVEAMLALFADGAKVITSSHGVVDPADIYDFFLTNLQSASTSEENIFCQLATDSPAVTLRFVFRFSLGDPKTTVYLPQLNFVREEDGQLKFKLVEVFKNGFLGPGEVPVPDVAPRATQEVGCSERQLELVRAYVNALDTMDAEAMTNLFENDGTLVLTGSGASNAREAFGEMLPTMATSRAEALGISCQVVDGTDFPSVLLRFRHTFSVKESEDEEMDGVFIDQFSFAEAADSGELLISKVEAFANSNVV